jgi:hypothetical protein
MALNRRCLLAAAASAAAAAAASAVAAAAPAGPSALRVSGLRPVALPAGFAPAVRVPFKLGVAGDDAVVADADIVPVAYQLRVWDAATGAAVVDADAPWPSSPGAAVVPPSAVAALRPGGVYTFRVRVQSAAGAWSPWSDAAPWHVTPGRRVADWAPAGWICTSPSAALDTRATRLRTEFTLPAGASVASATLHIAGLGQFVAYINGGRVSADTNAPPQTAWATRVLFSSYDVAALLAPGAPNALAIELGNGMYNVPTPPDGRYTKWTGSFGPRMALATLTVDLADGTTVSVVTAPGAAGGWAATDGAAVSFSHEYAGEDYNATLETPGWDQPGFAPAAANPAVPWAPAGDCSGAPAAGAALEPATADPVQVMEVLPALNWTTPTPGGSVIVDMGRNFAGFAEVAVAGVPPGYGVRVWPAETFRPGPPPSIDQSSGGTPMYWQWLPNVSAPAVPVDVTFRPTFSTYGWRWLEVALIPPPAAAGGAGAGAAAAAAAPGPFNGTMTVLFASYGVNCNPSLVGDETAAVGAWCNGTQFCNFAVCVCGDNTCAAGSPPCLPDPADNCAKDFSVTFRCSGDAPGVNRTLYIPAEADNSVAALTCGPQPPPPPAPNVTAATGFFTRASAPTVGTWSSSSDWVNRIHNITVEAIAANMQSVLTDCPHRERLGWLEVSTLMFPSIAYNFDISRVWAKIARDTVDSQLADGMIPDIAPEYTVFSGGFRDSPEWGSAGVLNPFWLHAWYGDVDTLNATWRTATTYVDYLLSRRDPGTGLLTYGLGDWIPVVNSPAGVTPTATLVQDLQALAVAAEALGRPADAANYTALAATVAAAYETAYWNGSAYPTQCAAGMALTLNITAPDHVAAAQAFLVADVVQRGNVTTSGEIGNRYALLALAAAGGAGADAVWASLLRTDAPGYGWMLVMGETALAETWFDSASASHIHAMYGHIDEYLYAHVAGIQRAPGAAGVGWRAVRIAPTLVPGLDWVDASFDAPSGRVAAAYTIAPGGGGGEELAVEVTVTVPPGVDATVVLPVSGKEVPVPGGRRTVLRDAGPDPRARRR